MKLEEKSEGINPMKTLTPHQVHVSVLKDVSEEAMKEVLVEDKKLLRKK